MKAVDLYVLSRNISLEKFASFEKQLSNREDQLTRVKSREIETLKLFVSSILNNGGELELLDNWFYSFSIPQLSKEFDLLKIDFNCRKAINVELKSQQIEKERIEYQLKRNQYYLSGVVDEAITYTLVKCGENDYEIYKLENKAIRVVDIEMLISDIETLEECCKDNIEELFTPKDYLISPINDSDRFIEGKYFLTNPQNEIKLHILNNYREKKQLYGITGSAGTGKTLLIYDIAKEFSTDNKVCIIHSGKISAGHILLNKKMKNVDIIAAKKIKNIDLNEYKYVIVDEAQRLYRCTLEEILKNYASKDYSICIFAYDYAQVLSKKEKLRNNPEYLRKIAGFNEERLSERIRCNKEIYRFIGNMMNLSNKPKDNIIYKNIEISYADGLEEANNIVLSYQNKGYVFITLTPSQYYKNGIDEFSNNINSHDVVGQEFDRVVVVIDDNFKYSEDGVLQGRVHPNPDYIFAKLFYQNITRAREKLAIIVWNNLELFEQLLTIM